MAVIAGAGNPAGSGGTSGIGKGLTYVGNFAYAYSGAFADSQNTYKPYWILVQVAE